MDLSLANLASFSALNTPLIIVATVLFFPCQWERRWSLTTCRISSSFCHSGLPSLFWNTFTCLMWKEVAPNVLLVDQYSSVNYLFGISRYLGGRRELFLNCSLQVQPASLGGLVELLWCAEPRLRARAESRVYRLRHRASSAEKVLVHCTHLCTPVAWVRLY